ncbi:MAG: leucyl/phenylalanyl-tRNA--protein transferase [Desulfobacteraceae bacterium]|nr:leucyl/phenylalanyl-tRNA--protein transferase [Desulfobacteraceae bacterium]
MPVFILSDELSFPPAHMATSEGLLAVGGDLSMDRLLLAYQHGIFPWYSEGEPILWWSPDPRLVLYPNELHVSRRLKRSLKKNKFTITMDDAFEQVIGCCANTPRRASEGTWITPSMNEAYIKLHRKGYAHSVETWDGDKLVGGLYGVSLGRAFFGESMFSHANDASKAALVHLANHLKQNAFDFIDCQIRTDHLLRLGAREVPRKQFLNGLANSLNHRTHSGRW